MSVALAVGVINASGVFAQTGALWPLQTRAGRA